LRERVEEKRKRRRSSETAASCKARAVIAGPVQVGKIDLNPKKAAAVAASCQLPGSAIVAKVEAPKAKLRQKSQL
jgi:translation initiation factor IF-2